MKLLIVVLLLLPGDFICAQQTNPYDKFGKITVDELQKKIYSIDSNANAVVLSDVGEAAIVGNSKNWFSISFKRHRVIHILNRKGYDEATVTIPLYTTYGGEEKLETLKGVTYNLVNGKIVQTKLNKADLFTVKLDKHWINKKFTFPNIQEGCIIEYEYATTSDFIDNLEPWFFQSSIPEIWSEYKLSLPQFFTYTFLNYGYHPFAISDKKNRTMNFGVMDSKGTEAVKRLNFSAGVTDYRWVMKEVPSLQEESFTSSIKNHIARIEFQLSSQSEPLALHDYRNSWSNVVNEFLQASYFGDALDNSNRWLSDELKPVLSGAVSETEKAKRLYQFVRDNFFCTNYSSLGIEQSLKNVMKARVGTVSELNILLTAMLRYAGLKSNPVILSTTDNGYVPEQFPLITSFNYVVSQCVADGQTIYLDASHPHLGFGKLLPACYNGHARAINETADSVYFVADSLLEKKISMLFVTNDKQGNWVGAINETPGYFESYDVRNEIAESGEKKFFEEIQKDYGEGVSVKSAHVDSLTNYESPVALKYEVSLKQPTENEVYINPMFGHEMKTNPFRSAKRFYPVEMPYKLDQTFILTMQVPEEYEVEALPEQVVARLDENESAFFEYRISQSGSTISLRSRIKIARTFFTNEEYQNLREFFNIIVNKQNERLVLKRKN